MIDVPHVIKYMGSKRSIIDFVASTILNSSFKDQRLIDLFGGSAVVSGSLRDERNITCNDIQSYTGIIAKLYLQNYDWNKFDANIVDLIIQKAQIKYDNALRKVGRKDLLYTSDENFSQIKFIEDESQLLINTDFTYQDHLFAKNYSGTYWSLEQCLWIDAISSISRSVKYKNTFLYPVILSSLMFSMSYCSQSTGHYAQHRVLTEQNADDVLIYRRKDLVKLFRQKFTTLKDFYTNDKNTCFNHNYTTKDFIDSLNASPDNSIIYADPPYQFVHYSRFYHALETLVKYDYPIIQHKGRYREERHQSPFCIGTKVRDAFKSMFTIIYNKNSTLVLSYSDNGMISFEELFEIASSSFKNYEIEVKNLDYKHSTMGRSGDKNRNVREILIIMKPLSSRII